MTPVFVLSCMRSYSSLVCGMLGQHPQLYGVPEINLFVADTLREQVAFFRMLRPTSLNGLLRTVAELEYGEQTVETVDAARGWIDARLDWTTRRLYEHLAWRVHPRRIVDKCPITPMSMPFLERMRAWFPTAEVLHLTRHPRPTCISIHKLISDTDARKGTRRAGNSDPEDIWWRANSNALAVGATMPAGQYMAIQGEMLLSDPDRFLDQVGEFLSVRRDADAIAAMKHPETSPFARIGPANAPFGNDPNFLNDPTFRQRPIPAARLEGPVTWPSRSNREVFDQRTVWLARRLGYR